MIRPGGLAPWVTWALLTASSVWARAQIFQPGTQPLGSGHAEALSTPLQSSAGCARCHGGYDDRHVEPYDTWRGSMMANAARDPVALAAIAIAEADHPDAEDFCVRCHSPVTWLNGRASRPEYDPATGVRRFARDDAMLSSDRDGIACMACHRAEDSPHHGNAQLVIAEGAARLGPYAYAAGLDPRHETRQVTHLSESRFCAGCHDIANPLLTGHRAEPGGVVATGRPFVVESTFTEWLHSDFSAPDGQSCQGCHMPEAEAFAASEFAMVRPQMSQHDLVGGSVWQPLAIFAALPAAAMTPALDASYRAASERARSMLERAARLTIESPSLTADTARWSVRVENLSGHKLPSGYVEGRRMWLRVHVRDASGRTVASVGDLDAGGHLLDHAQLRTYQARFGELGEDGVPQPSFHFMLADTLLEDTRIPPQGFRPPADSDIDPLGRPYRASDGSYVAYDLAPFVVSGLCGQGTASLEVELLYQSNTREYMEFLRETAPVSVDPDLAGRSWGQVAFEAWERHGGSTPTVVARARAELGSLIECPDSGPGLDASVASDADPHDAGEAGRPRSCGCHAPGAGSPFPLPWLAVLAVLRRRRRARGSVRGCDLASH